MKKIFLVLFLVFFFITPTNVWAADIKQDEYVRAKVLSIESEGSKEASGILQSHQVVKVKVESGIDKGQELVINHGDIFVLQDEQKVKVGDEVVLVKTEGPTGVSYYISDKFRLPALALIVAIFVFLAVLFAGLRGLTSIAGLVISVLVLIFFIVPQIINGRDPLLISFVGSVMIAIVALYVAHGVHIRTSIALVSTLITLLLALILSAFFVSIANLSGSGSEEAIFLQTGVIDAVNLKGLLLGGIIIGALGVLDDITTSQTAAVEEVFKANPKLTLNDLIASGVRIGREHIASLINTLFLAYAGTSLPLLLLFTQGNNPLWVTLNSEFIAEEIVRTLVGSSALILAVPISTFLAAYVFTRYKLSEGQPHHNVGHKHK